MLSKILMCCGAGMTVSVAASEAELNALARIASSYERSSLDFKATESTETSHHNSDEVTLEMVSQESGFMNKENDHYLVDDDVVDPQCPHIWADDVHQPPQVPNARPNWYQTCAFKTHSKPFVMQCNDGSCWNIQHGHSLFDSASWNWGVCSGRGGRMVCPGIMPYMCAVPNVCYGDFCCEPSCSDDLELAVVDVEIDAEVWAPNGNEFLAVSFGVVSVSGLRWCDNLEEYPTGCAPYLQGNRQCEWGLCNSPFCADKDDALVKGHDNYVNDCECWSREYDYGYLTCQNGEEIRVACDIFGGNCTTKIDQDCDDDHCLYFDSDELPASEDGDSIIWSYCNSRGHRASCPYSHMEMCGNPHECSPEWILTPGWEYSMGLQTRYTALPDSNQDHCCAWHCSEDDGGLRQCPVYVVPFDRDIVSITPETYVMNLGRIVWGTTYGAVRELLEILIATEAYEKLLEECDDETWAPQELCVDAINAACHYLFWEHVNFQQRVGIELCEEALEEVLRDWYGIYLDA